MPRVLHSDRLSLPRGLLLGSYGGGDDIRFARPILQCELPASRLPAALREAVLAAVDVELERQAALPDSQRVAVLPRPGARPDDLDWSAELLVSSCVYAGPEDGRANLFWQGWLYHDRLERDPAREGIGSYPLVGVFGRAGPAATLQCLAPPDDDAAGAWLPEGAVRASDLHAHQVGGGGGAGVAGDLDAIAREMLGSATATAADLDPAVRAMLAESMGGGDGGGGGEWHIGSDMARVLAPSTATLPAVAWCVCVDHGLDGSGTPLDPAGVGWRARLAAVVVVPGPLEADVERALRESGADDPAAGGAPVEAERVVDALRRLRAARPEVWPEAVVQWCERVLR